METRKPALSSVPVHDYSIGAQADTTMEIQAPLTAVYVQTVPTIPIQPYLRALTDTRETSALHLAMPSLYSKETLPFLTLHLAGGLQPQLGLSAAASTPPSVVKPKSAGKHVCPHCGRDCMKPSVLEKHLRCHTGERPYPCTTCGVSFKTQSNLYKHRRTQAHARQSSESEQSNVGSLDSMSSSRETCSFSLSFDEQSEQLGSEVKHATLSSAETTNSLEVQSSVSEQREKTTTIPNAETNDSKKVITEGDKQNLENTKNVLNINRHLQLQRQEATLFSKQWESSLSRGKSQSHGSTDSGFSESSDPYPSPSSVLHEHCADSHSRSSREHLDENHNTSLCSEEGHGRGHEKDTAREQVQKRLEERISKLISENSVVVEDKQLENVRPRKTVLSKQGSIDLPMPYTYKDSFHFDIKINPAQSFGIPRHHKPGLYNSVPTQGSATIEHVTLPRSNSLPSHPTLLQPERERSTSYSQNDHAQDIRRRSSGQMNPTGLLMKPVNQHSSAHRPLVRQTAVDCNHTTDSPLTTSSVEEACTRRLSCDPDGNDIIGERNSRRLRRKKAQKFAYNKWYMYGGGTFKKLYDPDNSGKTSAFKGRKCSTNISQETDQNIPKMVSLIHKETITSSGSTVHFSTSNGSGGHHSPKSSGVSSVDVNVQSCQLNSPNGFVKAPPRRHLSLSVLPLSGTRSAAVHTECLNQTEAGRLINVAKPSDTTMELCKPHVPSDRKKQKTVEKMTSPLESEIEPNTQTQEPVSVTGSADSEVTGPTFFKAKEIPNSLDLKRALLFPYLLNTNASQISTSAATSVPIDANTSFLPKYQLNLPNAHEPDLVSLPQDMSKSKATDGNYPTPALLYNSTNQTSVTAYKNIFINPITLPCMQAQDHPCLGLHSHSLSPSVSGMQKQFAAATITTNCFQDYTTRLCSTLLHGSKTATNSVHKQLPKPLANLTTSLPLPTLINQTSAATTTCLSDHLSYHSANPTLEQSQLLPESVLANPGNIVHVDSNAQVGRSCIVPLDEKAQNVFHVHTADLQICLQLISDEQMALIAPQIEHQSGPSMSQLCEIEGMTPEGSQKITNVKDNQKEDDRQVSLPRLMSDRVIPLQSVQHSDACKTGSLTQPLPSQSPSQHPHNNSHLIMVTQTRNSAGSIMATSASFRVETTGGNQTSETKQVIFPKLCAEENFFSNRRVSQIGMVPKKNSGQHESCVRCVSTSAAYPANLLDQQQKKTQHAGADVLQSRGGAVACKISRTESTESLKQVNSGTGIGGSVSLFSVNNSEVPRQLNLQGLVFHTQQVEPMSQSLIKQANMQLNRMEPSVNSCSSLESFPNEIRTVIRREYLEEPHALSTLQSSSVDIKKLDKSTSFQSPTTGITEEAQKDPSAQEHRETLVQPGRTEWKPKQNQGEPEKKHICLEEQGVDELTGDDQNRQFKTPESCCRNVAIRDMTKHKGEETNLHVDLYKISCLSEKHLESVSQKNSGISECPPPNPLQVPHTSQNSDLATSTNHPNLLDSSPLEINHLYPQQNGDGGIISYSQQMQDSCESNRSQHTPMPISSSETQNAFLCAEPSLQSFSRQDQTKSTTSLSAQQGYTTTSNYSCDVFKVQTTNNHSVLPDFRTLSSMYLSQIPKVCRSTGEMTGDIQILQDNHITISPSQPFSLLEKKVENMDAPDDFSSNSRNPEGSCSTNKYQSMFMIGPFHGYQSADCLSSGVRPVPTSQENTEDPSSSDDEGKLIIEL